MEIKPTFSSSSSSSSPPAKRFDVFLSFRGEDTRNNFTGHLSLALRKVGLFNIFKDDYALEKGKDIWPELKNSIKDSQYAVVVLSENYATSRWCLRELAKIVKCAGNETLKIRTIFYHVNPSDVRNVKSTDERKRKGSFWEAMEAHQQNPSNSEKTLEKWRNALVTVANQSGYPVDAHSDEAIFIKEFVAEISHELVGASITTIEGLFGMTSRLKNLDSYVVQSLDTQNLHQSPVDKVCFIGIHGMGGIGKSTLARAYYKKMSHKFDGGSFLQNVREVCEKNANGLVDLQKQLLSDILGEDFKKIRHVDDGIDMIRNRLCRKKVIIILDDVSKPEQLDGLVGEDKWFGPGSIIIVTTREDNFLKIRRYEIYRAEFLNYSEALQLFSSKAFRSIEPPEDYKKLSEQVVKYAGYLPLALTVLGSHLGSKDTREWESGLRRLRQCPEKEIIEKLKISFDDLNETDQCIFLDIACFYKGHDKDYVIPILDSCGFEPIIGIRNLINKSLLSIQHDRKLWMHDLLQEMGKEIVRKESGNEQGRQSRIWDAVDLCNILKNKEGTNKVEAIDVTFEEGITILSFEGFSYMKKLRLLKISGYNKLSPVRDAAKLEYLSNDLQFLQWNRFPFKKFPPSFQPRRLVQLKARNSNIEQLWNSHIEEPKYSLNSLKVIDLTCSASFSNFEDFTVVPNLERLILEGCTKLSEIHPSIKHLQKLILLNLNYCTSLKELPKEINGLASLQILKLYGCSKLHKLPDNLEQLKHLRNLDFRRTGIKDLPSSIFLMENLESVSCTREEMLESAIREKIINYEIGKGFLPCSFFTTLTKLDLNACNLTDKAFPEYFGRLVCLQYLDLSENPFSVLPTGINGLSKLKYLRLVYCESLRCLEAECLPSSLEVVYVNYCTSLSSFLDPLRPCHLRCSSFCLDCTELVKSQDGEITALASLKRFLEVPSIGRRNFEIVLPLLHPQSDELSAWFIKQSLTASISINLDPNRRNNELRGFAMVFCFGADSRGNDFFCDIRVCCSKNCNTTKEVHTISLPSINSRMSDHLFLLYRHRDHLPRECIKELESSCCDHLEFSFYRYDELSLSSSRYDDSCGPCGVRLIYEEGHIENLNDITSNYDNESPNGQKDHVHSSHSKSIGEPSQLRRLDDNFKLVKRQKGKNSTTTLLTSPKRYVQDRPNPTINFEIDSPEDYMDVVIRGSEVPSWFKCCTLGPSMSTQFLSFCCLSGWIGFALFACFRGNSSSDNFYCLVSFLDENLKVSKGNITKSGSSENVWLLYLPHRYLPPTWLHNRFGKIEFSFHAQPFDDSTCIGPCGVRMVYREGEEKLYQIFNEYSEESPDEEDDGFSSSTS